MSKVLYKVKVENPTKNRGDHPYEALIRQKLTRITNICLTLSRWFGFCIFSFDSRNELHFSIFSFSAIWSLLNQFVFRILGGYLFDSFGSAFMLNLLPPQTPTEIFTGTLLTYTYFFNDTINTFIFIFQRHKIIRFQSQLNSFIVENSAVLDTNSRTLVYTLINSSVGKVKFATYFIVFFSAIYFISSAISFFLPVFLAFTESIVLIVVIIMMLTYFTALVIVRVLSKIWLIGILNCIKICFHLLSQKKSEENILYFLDSYRRLEELVDQFNHAFGPYIVFEMVVYVVVLFTNAFATVIWASSANLTVAFVSFGVTGIIHLWLVFTLCNLGNSILLQSVSCTELLRSINIDRISHNLQIQISSAIATYIIILLQFQNDT